MILFGHTHYPVQELLSNGSVYINTGSWVQDFSDALPETWEALFNGSHQINDIPTRLSYARIEYDENDIPTAKLLYFNKKAGFAKHTLTNLLSEFGAETKSILVKTFNWIARILGTSG